MKVLIVSAKPFLTEQIAEALAGIGIVGITVTEARDFSQDKQPQKVTYRGVEHELPYESLAQLEVITQDNRIDDAVELIESINRQYNVPDAKIIIKNMDDTIRIRDGQHGDTTL